MTATDPPLGDLLVVIPCLNEARTLLSLLTTTVDDVPQATVVVADGGSTDGSREIVREFARRHANVALLDNPDRIQGAGINRAVERFGADRRWLVRLDAHSIYPRGYVPGLVRTAVQVGAESVTVPMRTIGLRFFQRAVAIAQNSVLGTGGSAHRTGMRGGFVDHGHHALMNLAAFRRAGGYCEQMTHNEDAELDIRLTRSGARIWLEPELAIDYFPRATPGALFRQYLSYGAGRARTILRHRIRPRARQAAPLAVLPAVAVAPLALSWWPAAIPALAWAGLCAGWGAAIALRRREPCALLAGPAAIIMHLGWSTGFWRAFVSATFIEKRRDWRSALRFQTA